MKNLRLKQFGLSLVIVLSLCASSLAACACSHHLNNQAELHTASCHQMADEVEHSTASPENSPEQVARISDGCSCFVKTLQPVVVSKTENIKPQKNSAILPSLPKPEKIETALEIPPVISAFTLHFYNSNYLRKLTPARAPPVL